MGISTVAILIRCIFRVAELSGGFNSSLANNQVSFMVLDGAMMSILVIVLTAAHPGIALGSVWQAGGFRLRKGKGQKGVGVGADLRLQSPENQVPVTDKEERDMERL